MNRLLVGVATGAAAVMLVAGLAGCASDPPRATPTASPTAARPASSARFSCPPADRLAALTATPFSRAESGATCTYSGGDGVRIELRHPAKTGTAPATTLSNLRAGVQQGGAGTKDARDLGFDAFTTRPGADSCTAWFLGPDGVATTAAVHVPGHANRACGLATSTATLTTPTEPTAAAAARPVLRVIAPAGQDLAWTAEVARTLNVRVDRVPSAGQGFVRPPSGPFLDDAVRRLRGRTDAVVLVTGIADAGADRLTVQRAASAALSRVSVAAPRARKVVVGPLPDEPLPTGAESTLNADLHTAANVAGAAWIDPIDGGWRASGDQGSDATQQRLADAVVRALRSTDTPRTEEPFVG